MSYQVTEARPEDTPIIAEFQQKMAWETEEFHLKTEIVNAGVAAVFQEPSRGRYFVAKLGDDIVASMLTTYEWSDWRNGNIFWLQSVYVLQPHRGKGVFKRLYRHIQNMVEQDPNYVGIRLYVEKSNLPAQKVYQNIGMKNDHYDLYEWMV